jgi:predicted amidohydrolase
MTLIIAAAQSESVPGEISANVAVHLQFGAAAAELGVHLLVFPELSLTGYEPACARSCAVRPDDLRLEPLRRLAEEANMTVVAGVPLFQKESEKEFEKDELNIGALIFRPDGSVLKHTKEHLHPGEEATFTPGQGGPVLVVEDANVGLAICADTMHSEHPASAAARGANVYAAGVLIPESGYAADALLLSNYARNHTMAVLMANHSRPTGGWVPAGKSAIWSEDGMLVAASRGTEEALIIGRRRDEKWDGMVLPLTTASTSLSI